MGKGEKGWGLRPGFYLLHKNLHFKLGVFDKKTVLDAGQSTLLELRASR